MHSTHMCRVCCSHGVDDAAVAVTAATENKRATSERKGKQESAAATLLRLTSVNDLSARPLLHPPRITTIYTTAAAAATAAAPPACYISNVRLAKLHTFSLIFFSSHSCRFIHVWMCANWMRKYVFSRVPPYASVSNSYIYYSIF